MLKQLSNRGERRVRAQLVPACEQHGAVIDRKMRIADVVSIDELGDRDLGRFALMAHFDFVVADDNDTPLFAVEFDGAGHSDRNDNRKNEICRRAGLALFRIGTRSSFLEASKHSFVGYLAHIWFLARAFANMRDAGELHPHEPFVASGFLRQDARNIFDSEFDLLGPARIRLVRYCKSAGLPGGPFWHMNIAELLLSHDELGLAAFTSFPAASRSLYGRATIDFKLPALGFLDSIPFLHHEIGQFCIALAIYDLIEELKLDREAGHITRKRDDIAVELADMKALGYRPLLGSGADPDFQAAW